MLRTTVSLTPEDRAGIKVVTPEVRTHLSEHPRAQLSPLSGPEQAFMGKREMLNTAIIDDHLSRARQLVTNANTRPRCQEARRKNPSLQHALEPVHTVTNAIQDLSSIQRRPGTPPE